MKLIGLFGVVSFVQAITEANADLGDWLCKMMGICA